MFNIEPVSRYLVAGRICTNKGEALDRHEETTEPITLADGSDISPAEQAHFERMAFLSE